MSDESRLIVVALGGNAIQSKDDDSVESDFDRTMRTAERLAALVARTKSRMVVTHGNGPQVGNHLLRSELAHDEADIPLLPLEICVADTQGGMGYMLQQCLANAFHAHDLPAVVSTVVTQVVVDREDPAFESPSKPIGEFIAEARAAEFEARGWTLHRDRHRGGWRRVVPSPDPKEIVEAEAVRALTRSGVMVVACGGGGVPVVEGEKGLEGVAAVVDKDLASSLLACDLAADGLVILTDVDRMYVGYDSPDERALEEVTVDDARAFIARGEFPPGSMGPKVEALCRFVEATGGAGLMASIEEADRAFEPGVGTRVVTGVSATTAP